MKKLLAMPGASPSFIEKVAHQIKTMGSDKIILLDQDVKIYNIDDAVVWSKQEIEEFLDANGIQWKQTSS